ncbi:MupA/Atu3671 family FMN-dependent luciferase-like monooxygenase [Streptomyces sp. NPDC005970]|uniref:MupA/Atu3671 family FMN-dependent luciferase-like monooxygenase n=1 Tax=Streptomyces sp. NPDC005970 TaxID=3156723 RepID=UPI003404D760
MSVPRTAGMAAQGGQAARAHADELIRRYTARTAASRELAQRHRRALADSRASVGFRSATKEMLYPLAARRARGSRLEDIDGNAYVDITMGFGVLLFGHEPEFVTEAVRAHLADGLRLGPRGPEAGEAAELLAELTGMERVAFANSGTEANSAAIRLARAATGRDKIVTFRGAYHGHADNVLGRTIGAGRETVPVSSGIPHRAVADLLVLDYGAPDSLRLIEESAGDIAAVLVEPVQSRNPALQPVAFVRSLRELTRRHGIVLLFDEMLTGLRPHQRGAQDLYGVVPDLATYGKVLGGGFPIGAIAGRADLLDGVDGGFWRYGDDSYPPRDTTFFGGTYLQHPVSMAAARAVLTHLKEQGPDLQCGLNARTQHLADTLNAFFAEEEFPLRLAHFGSMFRFEHRADMELFYYHLLLRGVHVWEWRNFFLSTAHTDHDIERITDAVTGSLLDLRRAGFFPRTTPEPARPRAARQPAPRPAPEVSLYFFGDYPEGTAPEDSYELIADAARFADSHGFHALWLPERHFHTFGGPFPNPAVLASALARETSRIRLNAGSVVLPLHDPIRVAEEWSMADNLSHGRIGIGCASGWHARDFVFFPERFGHHKELMYEQAEQVRALWRGEPLRRPGGAGETEVRLFPRPVQDTPPMFTAIVGNPDSYARAARHDMGVVTNLMSQSPEQLAEHIALYRRTREEHGLDPDAGRVVVLLHTYLTDDPDEARRQAYEPLSRYMRSSLSLFGQVANSLGHSVDIDGVGDETLDAIFRRAYGRYCDQRSLIGSPESCRPVVDALREAGVDEIAALVDFGVSPDRLRAGLPHLERLRRALHPETAEAIGLPKTDAAGGVATAPPAPLSPGQRRIWLHERLLPGGTAYNEATAIRLDGPLDLPALRHALTGLAERHEMLRTVFPALEGEPRQVVRDRMAPDFALVDRPGTPEEDAVREAMAIESARRFDLADGPLFVFRLLRLGEARHVLVFSFHHIVADAHSVTVLTRDLSLLYRAALDGGAVADLTELRCSYREFAQGRAAVADSDPALARDLAYWTENLGGEPPVLELPTDRPRPEVMTSRGRTVFRTLPKDLTEQLRELSRRSRATLFMTLLTGFATLLREVTGQEDIVVGTPVSDRPEGTEALVGFFLNTVALRFDLSGDPAFEELLARVRGTAVDAYDHATAPFDAVVRALAPPRDASRNPVFQVLAEYESGPPLALDLPGVHSTALNHRPDKSLTDLTVYFTARPDGVGCHLEYRTDLFDPATVDHFFDRFRDILEAAVRDPAAPLSRAAGPAPACAGPRRPVADATVHGLVADRVRSDPGRLAVSDGATRLTYGELDARAAHLAARLRAAEPGAPGGERVVALWLPRSADLVVAMLAVLRTGGAYLPLDPALGPQRVGAILADCGARTVLTRGDAPALPAPPDGVSVLDISAAEMLEDVQDGCPERPVGPDSLCYVIYTSGTTGRPKGVTVTHRNVAHLCQWHRERFAFTPDDRAAVVSSQSFDASVLEIWPALTSGASIAVAPEAARLDPPALARWYREERVTFSMLPTALGESVLALPVHLQPPLRHLALGGEVMRHRPRPGVPYETVNVYGPTETTVLVTTATVADAGSDLGPIPIGRPIDNTSLYLLGEDLRPVRDGDAGELYIGGPGVARGYLGRPEDTARRFLDGLVGGARLYRTGDLARRRPDGALEFVGRTDDQVKIRGFRVEPGEAAQVLRELPEVGQAAVVAVRDGRGEARLAGYVVPDGGAPADEAAFLRRVAGRLAERLPEYLVPRAWAVVDALPLSAQGKLDRGALPEAAVPYADAVPYPDTAVTDDTPSDEAMPYEISGEAEAEAEASLVTLWSAELGLDAARIGPDASFFRLGGDSIAAMRLLHRVREELGAEYPMVRFYQRPTVRAMTRALAATAETAEEPSRVRGEI